MRHAKTTPPRLLAGALLAAAMLLGPGATAQDAPPAAAAQVAGTAPLPAGAPYASEINAFQAADRKRMPPPGGVLFVGSSSVRFWDTLAQDFPEIPVINRGFGGSQIFQSTLYAGRIVTPYRPKIVVLFAGTNDLSYGGKTPAQVLQDFAMFADTVHAALPATRVVFLSISPTVARWKQEDANLEANYLIARWVHDHDSPARPLGFLDTHAALLTPDGHPQPALLRADGLHFNAQGYRVLTALVRPRLLALAAQDGVPQGTQAATTQEKQ